MAMRSFPWGRAVAVPEWESPTDIDALARKLVETGAVPKKPAVTKDQALVAASHLEGSPIMRVPHLVFELVVPDEDGKLMTVQTPPLDGWLTQPTEGMLVEIATNVTVQVEKVFMVRGKGHLRVWASCVTSVTHQQLRAWFPSLVTLS